jgi:cyclic pyranopterin phosphate synthase
MPKEIFGREYQFLDRDELLTFEEIERLTRIFHSLGVRKVRLTGGEPLVRSDIERLVAMLAEIPGLDLTMTTNGLLLPKKAEALKAAGLRRITVSLDSIEDETFAAMNDVGISVAQVLEGIDAAKAAGLHPIKVNMVVKRDVNESSILPMARHFKGSGHILRYIEFMDVGHTNGWRLDQVVAASEIIDKLNKEFAIEPVEPNYRGEVAKRWRYADGSGEVGVIASVTQPFCRDCSRVRLSADGMLYTCLFAVEGHDLRGLLRNGGDDDHIADEIGAIWGRRTDRYSEIRSAETVDLPKIEMSYIGG